MNLFIFELQLAYNTVLAPGAQYSDLVFLYITNGEGNATPLQYSCLENPMDRGAWWAAVHGVAKSRTWLSDFTFTFHFHALQKEMATHSSVLAWRIPGTGEPGGLPSMGSHRVGHDWSNSTAAAAAATWPANDHHNKSSYHWSSYKDVTLLLTVLLTLYISYPWLFYNWKLVPLNRLHLFSHTLFLSSHEQLLIILCICDCFSMFVHLVFF